MYFNSRIFTPCLISESSKNHHFYLSNYLCSIVIQNKEETATRAEYERSIFILLCRKFLTVKGKSTNCKTKIFKENSSSNSNTENKQTKSQQRIIINTLDVMSLTATFLDWCLCYYLQTDAYMTGNKWMRMSNGNGKVRDECDIQYQNIPGTLGSQEVGTILDTMVARLKPDILFIGEADSTVTKAACPEGYVWVGGKLKGKTEKIRMSAIISNRVQYKVMKTETEVPAVTLKVMDWNIVGIYREWAPQGDPQVSRVGRF